MTHPSIFTRLASTLALALTLVFASSLSAAEISTNGVTLSVQDKGIRVEKAGKPILDLSTLRFDYHEADSWKVIQATDDRIQVEMTFPASVVFHRTPDFTTPQTATLEITKVPGGLRLHASPEWSQQTTLVFNYLDDHFFGISEPLQPDNQLSPDLTGAVINLEVRNEGQSIVENYASAFSAFYISSHGYGSFFDSFARGRYDFAINGKNKIHHDTGTLDWYLFFGDNGTDIHASYFDLIGSPKFVPAWGIGPVAWRDQNDGGADEILADIQGFNKLQIPVTSWFVDRPYSEGAHAWSKMNFSEKFANPEVWIKQIREEYGIEFMTWTATTTFGDARFEKHLAGKFTYIDLTHEPSATAFKNELKNKQYVHGVKGHKIDRADEVFPLYEDWHDETIGTAQRRNKYAYLFAKVHDEALRDAWGDDQITFTRAAIHRVQPYLSAIWGGDPRSSWEGLQGNAANAIRASFMGFPVWGTDAGGYIGDGFIAEDLYMRWMQFASVCGLFEIKLDGSGGDGEDRMPWRYSEAIQNQFRAICEDRMNLLPYLYSLANTSADNGTIMQPMAYRHLDDANTYDIWDQFYVGSSILAAPVLTAENKRDVYLPEGNWRNYDDLTQRYEGSQTITIDVPLERLPRFVPENSIYVTGDIYTANQKTWGTPKHNLVIHALPSSTTGNTQFTYLDILDDNAAKEIKLQRANKKIQLTSPSIACPTTIQLSLNQAPSKVTLNGKKQTIHFESEILTVSIPNGELINLVVTTN